MKRLRSGYSLFFALTLVGFVLIGGAGHRANASPSSSSSGPSVWLDTLEPSTHGTLLIDGQNFTAGGDVYVAVYDVWGSRLYETLWTTASATSAGSAETANSTQEIGGGIITVAFNQLCGADVMVRAYDHDTQAWSNWVTASPAC